MIKITENTKVFVQCPAGVVTGGAELLHQLVDYLRNHGVEAFIVYYGNKEHTLPSDYKKYNIAISEEIIDDSQNISVLYEPLFDQVFRNTKIQKVLWWLSVDNFYICAADYIKVFDLWSFDKLMAIKMFIHRFGRFVIKGKLKKVYGIKDFANANAISAYQSEYAQYYLKSHGFTEMVALKDYINTEHCCSFTTDKREDIVLYNPKKGLEFTKRIIDATRDINWIPLQNMTRSELIEVMKKAKVYVDFGYHPGKDRLPRECAMNGLCVITGSRGSAGFFEDVPIENKYKFNEKCDKISDIADTIRWTLKNYNDAINDFVYYRNHIKKEKKEFENQIRDLFQVKN